MWSLQVLLLWIASLVAIIAADETAANETTANETTVPETTVPETIAASAEEFLAAGAEVIPEVVLGEVGSNTCPEGYVKITDERMCLAAMDILGPGNPELHPDAFEASLYTGAEEDADFPSGCYTYDYVYFTVDQEPTKEVNQEEFERLVAFNNHSTGSPVEDMTPICAKNLEPPAQGGILYVGDSDIDYWIESPTVGTNYSYNIGIGGFTCGDLLENDMDLNLENFLDYFAPSNVVLVCGENDLAYGESVDATLENLANVIDAILDHGASIVYLGTKNEPSTQALWSSYKKYVTRVRTLAEELCSPSTPRVAFVDVQAGFSALGNPDSLYAPDELHLSDEAYALWSEWTKAALEDETGCCSWEGTECVYNTTSGQAQGQTSDDDIADSWSKAVSSANHHHYCHWFVASISFVVFGLGMDLI